MTPLSLLALHGGLMILGLGVFTTFAVFIAIFREKFLRLVGVKEESRDSWKSARWFDLHLAWHSVGFFTAAFGLVVVFLVTPDEEKEKLRADSGILRWMMEWIHTILGIVVVIVIAIFVPSQGLPDEGAPRQLRREYYNRHGWVGRLSIIGAYINMILGLIMLLIRDGQHNDNFFLLWPSTLYILFFLSAGIFGISLYRNLKKGPQRNKDE
ncbi:hypothetical protein PROFUN_08172 [Planoprotostelium fungivorum]|uniref:Cytochrome b561 domain-containing protein n=1 Tax=Planoprotostelium fungivorum TaxID=1890364 RepID=A0A2P6N633_9EUKA|nr:hypothetical protein PROFUN_08172 [Planoprotostelium fungivorum]